jgi:hypothetical protein
VRDRQPATPPPKDGPTPTTYWSRPQNAEPLAPGQLIRGAWRLYRSAPRRFVLVAFIPETIRAILAIPGAITSMLIAQSVVDVMADVFARIAQNPDAYRYPNSAQLQAEFQDQLRSALVPQTDLAGWSAISGGAGIVVGLAGTAALTAAALAAAAGRPISLGAAYRMVAARRGVWAPILAIGLAGTLAAWLPTLFQTSAGFQAWAGSTGSPRSMLLGSLLGVGAIVLAIAIIVLAIRWALYLPVVLAETTGVWSGLARAAELTHGVRIRLLVASAGIVILQGLSVFLVAAPVGVIVGVAARSVATGFVTYMAASIIGTLLWAPILPAMLANAYRARVPAASPASTEETRVASSTDG